jgi:hypothetical protein
MIPEDIAKANDVCHGVTELPSTPKIKQQSSITNSHSETGHFHINQCRFAVNSAPLQLPVGVLELQFSVQLKG